ncbi:MAG: hypothetical protein ACREUB_03235 [Burkholderiales bacterium]
MKAISYAFFVSETEYPKLQAACPEDFPLSYQDFCAAMDRNIQEAAAENVVVEKVYVSVERFLAWCAEAKVQPSNLSRARYATKIGYPWGDI